MFENEKKNSEIFDCEFNHCTVLVYNAHSPSTNCKLTYHCDCEYDHNGHFKSNKNTQGENTPVIVYSMGDSRTLHIRKRIVIDGKGSKKKGMYCKVRMHHLN